MKGVGGTGATVLLALGLVLAGRAPAAAQGTGDRPTRVFLEFATVGLPLTAEAALEYPVLGLGVQLFANLNREASF